MTRNFISSEMLAVIENAREIVDWETPSLRAPASAGHWAPALSLGRLAIVALVSGEGSPEHAGRVCTHTIGALAGDALLKTFAGWFASACNLILVSSRVSTAARV